MQAIRIIEFDAGHRVTNHESKCATLHGHRYKLEAYAEADQLDGIGRVIDFSVIKDRLGSWIDEHWDHTTLVWRNDISTALALRQMPRFKEPYLCDFNPTAENMANFLIGDICPKLFADTNIRIVKIRLWETPNCYVEVDAWSPKK